MKRFFVWATGVFVFPVVALGALSYTPAPASIVYGATFSIPYAEEIGIDWKAAYRAMFEDLGVRHLRLPAYWSMVEPAPDTYEWDALDYEMSEARAHDATVILVVGKRVPRWPECHVPAWAKDLPQEMQQEEVLAYIEATVRRYRDDPSIIMWQVENEPYLRVFADAACGTLDEAFLEREIALVRSLDSRPVLLTDSGNLGMWASPYRRSDVFGTSVYLYFWNERFGAYRTVLPPLYYRVKENSARLLFGARPVILSELSLEPWLAASIHQVPLEEQLSRMSMEKFNEILAYAQNTHFDTQYLWGVEWWYYLKMKHGHPEFWEAARGLFNGTNR